MDQGMVFIARSDFAFKAPRLVRVKAGSRWWKTNTRSDSTARSIVMLAREGKGHIGQGYSFTLEQLREYFDPEALVTLGSGGDFARDLTPDQV